MLEVRNINVLEKEVTRPKVLLEKVRGSNIPQG